MRRPDFAKNRGPKGALSVLLAAIVGLAAAQVQAEASSRDRTVAQLRALETAWPGDAVRVTVLGGGGDAAGPLRIGESLVYRFDAASPGYLTAIHVDTHGAATLLYPRADIAAGRIGDGREILLPSPEDGFSLEVQPPVGRDVVYAIVTKTPITRRDLGLASRDVVVAFEPHEAPAFVQRLRETLDARAGGEVQVAHAVQRIEGRGEVLYRSADIVGFFGERTRSIRPAKLDLQIHFDTDSAALDDKARRNIDEFARALEDPKLAGLRFKVAGHTDDRGPEAHNLELSRRRAESVRRYLVENGIDPDRLEIEAHGERAPLMGETTDYARQMNRRVEFSPAR